MFAALGIAAIGLVTVLNGLHSTPALADEAKFYLDCPTTEVKEGDSFDVFDVRVTNHQHTDTFGATWHTDVGTAGTSDFVAQNTGVIWATDAESQANRLKRTFSTTQDNLAEGNETFTVRFGPTDNVVDKDDPTRDHKCEITIVDDDPNITDVEVTSSPIEGEIYGRQETIEITATFNIDVDVDGRPGLGMWIGSNWRQARYISGSGSDELVFGYTVKFEDEDDDGIKMDGGYRDSNGRWHNFTNHTAVTASGTDIVAHRAYDGIDDQSDHKVDGGIDNVAPTIKSVTFPVVLAEGETFNLNDEIPVQVVFSEDLVVTGSPQIELDIGGQARLATHEPWDRLSYGHVIPFFYLVQDGDHDPDGISIDANKLTLNGGTITDASRNTAVLTHNAVDDNPRVAVRTDFVGPQISTIAFTSDPGDDDTYAVGDEVEVTVTFDEDIDIRGEGTLKLVLDFAGVSTDATYDSHEGAAVKFTYTVADGDRDLNGIAIPRDSVIIGLPSLEEDANTDEVGGAAAAVTDSVSPPIDIYDLVGNPAALAHDPISDNVGHKVDGVVPNIRSIAITSDPGDNDTYGIGDSIQVTVAFSEDVTVTGTPQLELDVGGTSKTASYSITDEKQVVFSYTVATGDSDDDGIAIGANKLSLNEGTIKDAVGNDATLTHSAVSADSDHKVDSSDTTAPTVSSVAITSDPGDDDTYGNGDSIQVTVTFSEDVTVTGTPQLEIDVGGTAKTASYSSTSGAKVVFSYTVAVGDSDDDGIAIGANKLSLNEGTIQDGAGNDATLTHSAVDADSGHKVSAPGGL